MDLRSLGWLSFSSSRSSEHHPPSPPSKRFRIHWRREEAKIPPGLAARPPVVSPYCEMKVTVSWIRTFRTGHFLPLSGFFEV
ncbi:hypothetical protein CEXT_12581 [Caerostris extrusa]|uniref:Uncharacterized protein n=1 Tax=Caerostris extrusa TaxID=172846 RepID=A0AAV4PCS7_CAEEX|nr:hypothetical protein CEXT_12581 [Caerostris extrusa]